MRRLRSDKRFLILVGLVFWGSLGGSWVFSPAKVNQVGPRDLEELIADKSEPGSVVQDKSRSERGRIQKISRKAISLKIQEKDSFSSPTPRERESLVLGRVSLEKAAQETASSLTEALEEQDFLSVYDLLGEDGKGIFTQKEFLEASSAASTVEEVKIVSGPDLLGEWAELELEFTFFDQAPKRYLVVLRWEEENWKLFGTEAVN